MFISTPLKCQIYQFPLRRSHKYLQKNNTLHSSSQLLNADNADWIQKKSHKKKFNNTCRNHKNMQKGHWCTWSVNIGHTCVSESLSKISVPFHVVYPKIQNFLWYEKCFKISARDHFIPIALKSNLYRQMQISNPNGVIFVGNIVIFYIHKPR